MRRRRPVGSVAGVHRLMDSAKWPDCVRFDGKKQPCWCWFSEQQDKIPDEAYPGGEVQKMADYLEVTSRHDCNAPFDGSAV